MKYSPERPMNCLAQWLLVALSVTHLSTMFRPARQRCLKAGQAAEHEHHREYQNQGFVAQQDQCSCSGGSTSASISVFVLAISAITTASSVSKRHSWQ